MTTINKQKFLAELGRLLTFMYEEDRLTALDMYEKMFDSCSDVHALMQILASPTRQAVVIARAYDAADRKLQVQSVSREDEGLEDEADVPEFVLAIDKVYQQAVAKGLMEEESFSTPVLENQISIFDESDVPGLFDVEEDAAPAPVFSEAEAVENAPAEDVPAVEEDVPAVEENTFEEDLPIDEVDKFIASFSIDESQLVPEISEEAEEPCEEEPVEAEPAEAPTPFEEEAQQESAVQSEIEHLDAPAESKSGTETVRKARPFLMVLYTIFAIPLTIVVLALLLIPTVLTLALATTVILAGSASFAAAFGGFAVFADMLVILGTALIISAMGLILLWLFIWFIGGAMAGFVKSVIRLGGKCCYKEVPAV